MKWEIFGGSMNGGIPIAGWFLLGKIPSGNGWWLGLLLWLRTPPYWEKNHIRKMGVSSQMGVSKNGNSLKFYEGIAWENYIKFFKKQWIGWREIVTGKTMKNLHLMGTSMVSCRCSPTNQSTIHEKIPPYRRWPLNKNGENCFATKKMCLYHES